MLIEMSADLQAILHHWILDEDRGLTVPGLSQEKLDISGITYDAHRDVFWLTSDKGQSLFVYDYHQHKVTQRIPLGYRAGKKGKGVGRYQRIRKAEGVAISPDGVTLTIVSDKKDSRLYVYAIQE